MTIDEAIEVLELHNRWRKGGDVEMQSPIKSGECDVYGFKCDNCGHIQGLWSE